MNAAEKARLAQEGKKNQKLAKKQKRKQAFKQFVNDFGAGFIVYSIFSFITIIFVILTVIFEIKGIKATDNVANSFKSFFYIGIAVLVITIILLILGFKVGKELSKEIPNISGTHVPGRQYFRSALGFYGVTNEYYYHDHLAASIYYIIFGVVHSIMAVGLIVLLIFSLISGNL